MIISAAVKFRDTNNLDHVWPVHRHEDILFMIKDMDLPIRKEHMVYGFLNQDPKHRLPQFVTPFEAKKICRECGQPFIGGKENPMDPELKSTDIY